MNWQSILALLGLIKGSNTYKTVGSILQASGVAVAAIDSGNDGPDDLAAGALHALGDGFSKYGDGGYNQQGNIVDGLIAGLETYKSEMIRCGKIVPVNQKT